jgi:hypothetical protein
MKSLAVRVLSDFGVDGIEPQAFGSRKARLTLQLLAIAAGQAVPADVLIDGLWDTAPPARPEDQLAVLMSRLRSVLGRDRIEHRDHGYLLHCDWLDATELAMLTREVETRRETGHAMGASSALELVFAAEALLAGVALPTINYTADPEIRLDCVAEGTRPLVQEHVLKNAFGFGGTNSCVVLRGIA